MISESIRFQAIFNHCITSYEKADTDDTTAFGLKLEKIENMWAAVSKHLALNKPLLCKLDKNSEEEDIIACTAVIMEKQ